MRTSALAAAGVALAVAACGGASSSGPPIDTCHGVAAGCTVFTDLTATTATIEFGGTHGQNYDPKCAMVSVGQPVTFEGDFGTHPISETCGPVTAIPAKGSGTTLTVTFDTAGTYGYQCDVHHASGMAGAIQVVP